MKKIRCKECGAIIAYENEPITSGEISILCTARKPNGQRCKTVNVIGKCNVTIPSLSKGKITNKNTLALT